ncbi:MAG TPA: Rrf2 family transcriptional regulator [Armatimonadota bacterium]|nr:Rrf2 family transcriptional regulator [Armatimonadota bacterium]HQK93509.1 Rrf2 family transcriptional regulator [Armatimonadota bacterium]
MSNALRISEAASIGLHTVLLLAQEGQQFLSARDMARTMGVSEAHLSKVLQRLVRAGIAESARGPHGGFRLAAGAEALSLLAVYEAIDGPLRPLPCLLGRPMCDGKSCILGGLLASVNEQIRDQLASVRLSQFLARASGEAQ